MFTTEIEVSMCSVTSPSRHTWIAAFLETQVGNTGNETNLEVLSRECGKSRGANHGNDLPVS